LTRAGTLVLIGAGLALSACAAFWASAGDLTGRVAPHLGVYGAAFVAYLLALHFSRGLEGHGLAAALLAGVLWRLLLVPAPPLLSNDIYRYLWEARVQSYGGNPYAWSDRADAEKWAPYHDELWRRMDNKSYPAVYPPLWQLAARAVVGRGAPVAALKTFAIACEIGAWAALALMLRRRGLPPARLLVIAWSPLAIVEVAGSGHNDTLGLLCLCLSLLALEAGAPGLSAVGAALGFQAKLLPGFVALAWLRRYRFRHLLLGALVVAVLFVPFASAGLSLVKNLGDYSSWRFNESVLALFDAVLPSRVASVRLATGLVCGLAVWLAWRRTEPVAAGLAVVSASIALAAHSLPWYALWLLPWLVLMDSPGALLYTGTVGLAYLVYPGYQSGAGWQVGAGIRILEYVPCVLVAAWARFGQRAPPTG
jgi:alpha-1,6-mannosyltransferase